MTLKQTTMSEEQAKYITKQCSHGTISNLVVFQHWLGTYYTNLPTDGTEMTRRAKRFIEDVESDKTFIDRLLDEINQLAERNHKLKAFINTEAFKKIDMQQQTLLILQSKAMDMYYHCLGARLDLLTE